MDKTTKMWYENLLDMVISLITLEEESLEEDSIVVYELGLLNNKQYDKNTLLNNLTEILEKAKEKDEENERESIAVEKLDQFIYILKNTEPAPKIAYTVDINTSELVPITYEVRELSENKWECSTTDPNLLFPVEWRGLSGDELEKKTGVKGSISVHESGDALIVKDKRDIRQILSNLRVGKEYHFKELKKRKLEDNHWREGPTKIEGPAKIEEID
jgi:hypothetical protein